MSQAQLLEITDQLLTLPQQDVDYILSLYFAKKFAKKSKTKNKKITWENCGTPLREPTPEEKDAIDEFLENPELLSVKESAKFLEELKMSL